ncbi:nucleoporin NDC1, partial [Lecanoromycetidae sp. Uapishka_2]
MTTPRPSLYKELLTPALHRRFTGAAGTVLVVCYVEAVLIGDKSSSGIRTLLLFISALSIFVLRVAQLHIEAKSESTPEPLQKEEHPLTRIKATLPQLAQNVALRAACSFAFWELAFISQRFDARRKAIFSDIDRPTGSAWNQIMTLCLGNILSINNRITEFQNPTPATAPQQKITIQTLPRIAAPPRQDNIFRNPPPESGMGAIAKSYGQSPQPAKPGRFLENQRAETQKYLGAARQKLLTNGQQENLSSSGLLAQYNDYLMRFLRTPAGHPFRQTFKRRICTIVLGSPYSELKLIIDSINATSALALASLKEDSYGKVAKDVPLLIRVFCSTITSIEGLVSSLPAHWTDVEFSKGDRRVEEVDLLVESLKTGLKAMVGAFGQYANELGLGREELSTARKIAGMEEGE